MAAVMIGVDPHKGSHTAVAITTAEQAVGELRVRASQAQAEQLLGGRRRGRSGPGPSRAPAAWPPGTLIRTTRMTPGRSRSQRCARNRARK